MNDQISLQPIRTEIEYSHLYFMMDGDDQYLFSINMHHNSENLFIQWMHDRLLFDFHDFRLIYIQSAATPVGFVHNYDFDIRNGHCKTVVYIDKAYRNTGIGAFTGLSFIKLLFQKYPLRKIYSTVYAYNLQSIENHKRAGFKLEGTLKEYRYSKGKYCDLLYLSTDRETFMKNLETWKWI